MYIINRTPPPKRHKRALLVVGLLVVLAGVGVVFGPRYFQPDTKISRTPEPKVTKVLGIESKLRTFTAGPLTLSLPQDWQPFTPLDAPPGSYSWHNTAKTKGVYTLTAYIDNLPKDMAVNRVLAVESAGDRIAMRGGVSDNCINFVAAGRAVGGGSGREPARWAGVQFICDTGNYSRNVVGISSPDGQNMVKLTGPGSSHQIFLTYNDTDVSSNYTTFTNAIESLRLR